LSFGGGFVFYQFQHFGLSEHFCKEYGENLNFPAHLHQSFELIMVFSGNMEVTVDEKKYIINKNEVSMSFNTYVNLYRIRKACYILTNTNCRTIQCALECGYTSLRSFNRNFKLLTTLTPSEYRLKYKQ